MPLSTKIFEEIDKIVKEDDLKDLIKNLLQEEERGLGRWKQLYDSLIKDYVNAKSKDEIEKVNFNE